jgi:hypothetical protein
MARAWTIGWLAVACCVASCGQKSNNAPRRSQTAELSAGIAAMVGDEPVSTKLVADIAREQALSPEVARDKAVSDALFAAYAKQELAGSGWVESAEKSAEARALLKEIKDQAEAGGPPTDAEVEQLTKERWQELAHPALSRTTHAVVLVKSPADDAKAKRVAARLAAAVAGVSDSKEFQDRAKKVDGEGLEIRVEELRPVAADGRVADPDAPPGSEPIRDDPAFARAAAAIPAVGQQSPVVRSSFGYHVILLTERIPEQFVPLELRRKWLAREIYDRRARKALTDLTQKLSQTTRVEVDRTADDLMSRVRVR